MQRLWIVALALLASGCTAGRSTYFVITANSAWKDARDAGAAELSEYEFELASQYRDKAWEEWGYCDYQDAEELAKEATRLARIAEAVALHGEEERELMEDLERGSEELPDDFEFEEDTWLN